MYLSFVFVLRMRSRSNISSIVSVHVSMLILLTRGVVRDAPDFPVGPIYTVNLTLSLLSVPSVLLAGIRPSLFFKIGHKPPLSPIK